jgi:peptidoglycan/xylan/chitin deacetylase (PgdA/CDA1 family)
VRAVPPTIVSLTFDDGLASAYTARSILAAHGMHATFYINSARLGEFSGFMTWQQVQDLYSDGNEIAGHTEFHVHLPVTETAEAQRQICNDRVSLLNHGYPVTDFAYPYGEFNASVIAMVQACGYNSARTTNHVQGFAESIPPAQPYTVGIATSSLVLADLEAAVTNARTNGGWVPILFHSICDGCALGISQADFTAYVDWLAGQAANGVVVQTVQQVVGGSVQPGVSGPAFPPAPNGSNGLRNASLEQDANNDSAPDCWAFGGFGNNSATWTRTTAAHTGTYAERVVVSNYVDGDNKLYVQEDLGSCSPSVVPGHRYAITSWYQSTVPVSFISSTRDSTAFSFWTESPQFPASSGWALARWVTPVIPNGVNGIAFGLTIETNGTLTVDDLGIDDAAPTAPPDTTLPTVSLTAPASGATLSGVAQLTAIASDNVALDHVDFLVDGQIVGYQVNAPTTFSWNSRGVTNGSHSFAARAVDTSGNSRTSTAVTAFVSNQSIVNLIQNPSLESGSGNPPTCWALGGYGSSTFTWTRTGDAHTGTSAENLSITAFNAGDRKLVSAQDSGACAPTVTPGHTYTVTAWYKATRQPYIFLYYRKGNAWTFWLQVAKPISSAWTQATYTTPALPAGATNLSIGLGTDGVGSVTMDDFALLDNSPPADVTPPTSAITCNNSGTEGGCGTGFYSEPVNIQLTAVDEAGGSGVATIRYTTDGSDPTATHGTVYAGSFDTMTTVKYRAFDIAGNAEAIHTQPILIETTPPVSTISCNGAACASTAYAAAVSVTLAATDAGGSGLGAIYYTTDGTDPSTDNGSIFIGAFSVASTATVKYRAFDNAGNAEAVNSQPIQIDTTPPTSTISCNLAPCSSAAYAGPVSVILAATDDPGGSGVAGIRYTTDGTDPSPTNGSVYSTAFSVSTTLTVRYSAFDTAGNAEPVNDQLVTITGGPTDTTPPTSTISCNLATCSSASYPTAVSVTLAAADDPGGSGVAEIHYTTDGSDPSPTLGGGAIYSGPFQVSATTTVKYLAIDNAGNAESAHDQLIQIDSGPIDTTPPTSSISCNLAPCSSSAYPGPVSVTLSAADDPGGSGVAQIVYTTDGTDPSPTNGSLYSTAFNISTTTTVKYAAFDNAGNAEPVNSRLIQVDTVAPTSTIKCNGVACSAAFYNGAVSVSLTATDNTGGSGVASIRYTTNGTDPTPTNGTVYGGAFSVSTTSTVKYRAFDAVGNAEAVNSKLIQIDTVAPSSSIKCNAAACSGGFYASTVPVTLTATDNGGGSGVAAIRYTTNGADPTATTGTVYGGAFSLSSTTTLKYRAFDAAGNAEPVNAAVLQIDTTAPTTAITCNGATCSAAPYAGTVSVVLAASDDPGGSGVTSIRYTTNGTDPTSTTGTIYTTAFAVSATTTVKYRAFDASGHAEAVNARLIQIDTAAPTVSLTAPGANAILGGPVSLTANAADNVAIARVDFLVDGAVVGSATTAPFGVSWSSTAVADGLHSIGARAVDTAGNQTSTATISVRVANVNLLQNGSLEAASGSTPTCWALGGYGTNTFAWSRTSDAHSGSFGETVNVSSYTNGDRKLVNSQDAGACAPAVTVGRTYTMTAWYKSTVPALFFVYYRTTSGSWVYWTQSSGKAATSTWTQASFTTPAIPAGATNISVGLGITAAGTLTMDDLGLYNN